MPRVVSWDEVKAGRRRHGDRAYNTWFMKSSQETPDQPVAFLTERDLHRPIRPHWHKVDQFQVVVGGNGKLGRHGIAPVCMHFARAHTPYGPIVDDGKEGVAFYTLRAHFDPGANYLPETKQSLREIESRSPWQISAKVRFPPLELAQAAGGSASIDLAGVKDDKGLLGTAVSLAAGAQYTAPDPRQGGGQYLLVLKGSLVHAGKQHPAVTIVYLEPHEGPFKLVAGDQGLEALVMNFPRKALRSVADTAKAPLLRYKKWQCELCAFAYDEAVGMPDDGIAPGTRWADVPENWSCPDCSASKSDFRMVEMA